MSILRSPSSRSSVLALCITLSLGPLPSAHPAEPSLPPPGPRLNDCPTIFVHGLLGYGQDLHLPVSAWGGLDDYCEKLRKEGRRVFSATLGPVSSNWDRACELYAYIKGGRTDYGAAHGARHGHARFGRTYPGVHPGWGETDKVHLLCHSMGGQTARLLVQLLEGGSAEELAASPEDHSPLFEGGRSWVLGLVSFCSPHDGSSLTLVADYDSEAMKAAICSALAAAGSVLDLRLDHWGLARGQGESVTEYSRRLAADLSWYLGEDSCYGELRPSGAARLNRWVRARPDVYYFSWAASTTFESEGRQLSSWTTQALLAANALAMGGFSGRDGDWEIGSGWAENDGTVNTLSMLGPKLGSTDRVLPFSGEPARGAWNYLGCLESTDHMDLLGLATPPWYSPPGFPDCLSWYRYNLELLASLRD